MYTTTTTSTMRVSLPCCPAAWIYLNFAVRRDYSSSGCTGPTAPMTCIRTRRLAARLLVSRSHWLSSCARSLRLVARLHYRLTCCPVALALLQQRRAPRLLVSRSHRLYITFVVHRDYSSPGRTGSTSTSPCAASTFLPAAAALPRLHRATGCIGSPRRASGCLGTSRGSSSTTSPMPCDRVPQHVARLVSWLVVDYSALRRSSSTTSPPAGSSSTTSPTPRVRVTWHVTRLVVDYFSHATCPGALARRAARCAARRRLLLPRRASRCLSTSHSSLSTTFPTPHIWVPWHVARLVTRLVVDYFSRITRPGALAHHATRYAAHHRLLRLRCVSGCLGSSWTTSPRAAHRRLLHLHRAIGCLSSSRGSSSTTSPMLCDWVPQHVARLVVWLVVGYCSSRKLVRHASGCLGTSRGSSRRLSSTTSPTPCVWVPRHVTRLIVDFFDYASRPGASARHAARR
jgi:hypothetical protein